MRGKERKTYQTAPSCAQGNRRLHLILAILANFIEVFVGIIITFAIACQGTIAVTVAILIAIKRETHLVVLALHKFIIITLTKRRGSTLAVALAVALGDTTILDLIQRTLLLLGRAIIENRLCIVVVIVRLGLLLLRSSTLPRGLGRGGTITTCNSC
jgi:hypothetical protein